MIVIYFGKDRGILSRIVFVCVFEDRDADAEVCLFAFETVNVLKRRRDVELERRSLVGCLFLLLRYRGVLGFQRGELFFERGNA